uniref:Wsv324-like protein n=1 Tax=Metapenaeus ensis nimavirus TaxID=2133794 RepID=A0A401IPE7_9VIRU|nr:MAG: wsv324-like protein [Metapenaeus ensis nimavirus]GBG35487.1 wsv324-like protein [Metapenaeus ensis nimavirus]
MDDDSGVFATVMCLQRYWIDPSIPAVRTNAYTDNKVATGQRLKYTSTMVPSVQSVYLMAMSDDLLGRIYGLYKPAVPIRASDDCDILNFLLSTTRVD